MAFGVAPELNLIVMSPAVVRKMAMEYPEAGTPEGTTGLVGDNSGLTAGVAVWPVAEPRIFGEVSLSVDVSVIGKFFSSDLANFIKTVTVVANKIKKNISLFIIINFPSVFYKMDYGR